MVRLDNKVVEILKEECEYLSYIEENNKRQKQRMRLRLHEILECGCITLEEYTYLNNILG